MNNTNTSTKQPYQVLDAKLLTAFNDIQWNDELDRAIRTNDVQTMWALVDQHIDEDEASRQMVNRIPRIAYQINRQTYFTEMFAMPIIVPGGSDAIENMEGWKQASYCIEDMLAQWLPHGVHKTVFHGLRSYDHLGVWQPSVIRKHLQRAIPGEKIDRISYHIEQIQLPADSQRLAFITMVLTSKAGWPQLPEVDGLRDFRLRQVCSFALQNNSSVDAPTVLPPDRMQYAVSDGLALWMHQLNEQYGITGWAINLRPATPDVVIFTIKMRSDPEWSQFAVRKHMIGKQGLDDVLTLLQSIAPNLDFPNDMPPPEKKFVEY